MDLKSQFSDDGCDAYITKHSLRLTPVQEKLLEVTKQHRGKGMLGDPVEMQFLQMVVKMIGAKKTLDIGVFTGYSSLCIAMALPEDGKVVACDVNDDFANVGKPCWKEAGVDHKIDLRIAPAIETLDSLIAAGESGTFDYAFIDADKPSYMSYYERCLTLLRTGGVIAIDNTLWDGRVFDPSANDESTVILRKLNEFLHKDERIDLSFLRLGDGTTLCRKK